MDNDLTTRAKTLVPMKVGVVETFTVADRNFAVKRVNHNTWHLRDTTVASRSRFGTLDEIRSDVETTLSTGRLPPVTDPMW